MFLINKGECCKPPVHSHRLSLQFLFCLPALPGDSGKKKKKSLHFTHWKRRWVMWPRFTNQTLKALAVWPLRAGMGSETLTMTANLHWIWSARRVAHGPKKSKI